MSSSLSHFSRWPRPQKGQIENSCHFSRQALKTEVARSDTEPDSQLEPRHFLFPPLNEPGDRLTGYGPSGRRILQGRLAMCRFHPDTPCRRPSSSCLSSSRIHSMAWRCHPAVSGPHQASLTHRRRQHNHRNQRAAYATTQTELADVDARRTDGSPERDIRHRVQRPIDHISDENSCAGSSLYTSSR